MISKYKFLGVMLGLAVASTAVAEPTAFELAKKGNEYVGVQSKDKVVKIESDKSVGSQTPNIWQVRYYDPSVMFKCVSVKFGAGKEMDVSHPILMFRPPTSKDQIMDNSKLKVDSDRALEIAKSQPLLQNLTIKSSKMTLEKADGTPQWTVELWAARLKNPNDEADIGSVVLSATDGSVIKTDLRPSKVD